MEFGLEFARQKRTGGHGLCLPCRPNAPRCNSILLKSARQPFFSLLLHLFLLHLANRTSTTSETPTRHCRPEVPGTSTRWMASLLRRQKPYRTQLLASSIPLLSIWIEAIRNSRRRQSRLGHGVSTRALPTIVDHLQLLTLRQSTILLKVATFCWHTPRPTMPCTEYMAGTG